ncbi:HAD-IA family hydrolase [Thalassotalea psychrophila]|uniref:HAD-IA family hydrolase n=1 Tax=Thalassotalea psychrophila TaxID=3065647 RepID=A0ABY9TT03_9GAMM|nr:HAD-IA family hydrolase [Colwelliaceae bacterium SQ149]
MRFYRRLSSFKAISFDLDDTLYDNYPVISKAEKELQQHLKDVAPVCATLSPDFWWQHRNVCLTNQPELCHDVTALRLACMQSGFEELGFSKIDAKQKSSQAFEYFLSHRNNLQVPESVRNLLMKLKSKFPLVAISNGNVSIEDIGISEYFSHSFFAGDGNLQKPESDMFEQACNKLNIQTNELLHIGDCTHADIYGALQAGCQTIWINNDEFGIKKKPLKVLPYAEFDHVEQLSIFL